MDIDTDKIDEAVLRRRQAEKSNHRFGRDKLRDALDRDARGWALDWLNRQSNAVASLRSGASKPSLNQP